MELVKEESELYVHSNFGESHSMAASGDDQQVIRVSHLIFVQLRDANKLNKLVRMAASLVGGTLEVVTEKKML